MAWLAKLLGRGERPEIEEVEEAPQPPRREHPPVLLLMSDAAGPAAMRVMRFEDAGEACEYIEFWYPKRTLGTVYAIWALPAEPDERWMAAPEHRGEAVILIRDDHREGIIYPFSFADFETAWAFVRQESDRGLELQNVMVYWGVPIDLEIDGLGRAYMSPDAPPPFERAQSEVAPDVIAEAWATAARALAEGQATKAPAVEEEIEEPVAAAKDREPVVAFEGLPQLTVEKFGTPYHEIEPEPHAVAAERNGDQRVRAGREDEKTPASSVGAQASANGSTANADSRPQVPSDRYEVADELAKLLERRRFDRKEGPFKGFGSPRGRF